MVVRDLPSFSVLMSVYKKEKPEFLDKALMSLERQTVLPKEIVLVEDGRLTIKLNEVILKHENKNIIKYIIVKSPQNRGLASSLQLGTKYVTTDWIARMDSDDFSAKDRFEKQLTVVKKDPNLAIVGGQVKEFANNIENVIGFRKVPQSKELIYDFVKWRNPFNHPTVLINKDKLESVGGYKPFGNLEDYYLWSKMIAAKFLMVNLKDVLTYMRVDNGMYSRRGKFSNIKYFFRLRKFLKKQQIITFHEQIIGNFLMTLNIIMPSNIRKLLYQKVLHNGSRK